MKIIPVGPAKPKTISIVKPATVAKPSAQSSKFQFELADPDDRIGSWLAKEASTVTRYRIPFVIPKGREVEVIEDKGHKVLVHIDSSTTIYIDSEEFDGKFERV